MEELDQTLTTVDKAPMGGVESKTFNKPSSFNLLPVLRNLACGSLLVFGLTACSETPKPTSTNAKPVAKESIKPASTETQNPVDAVLDAVDPSKDTKRKLNDRLEAEATVRNQTGTNIGKKAEIEIEVEKLKNNKK